MLRQKSPNLLRECLLLREIAVVGNKPAAVFDVRRIEVHTESDGLMVAQLSVADAAKLRALLDRLAT